MQELKIGDKVLDFPLIQGGMGIGVSLGRLAGTVAREGCMGVISMVGIGYREENYYKDDLAANKEAFRKELAKAREIAKGKGIIAVNIMAALTDYKEMAVFAAKEKVDAIISGAGLPLDLPKLVEGTETLIAPIVSNKRALELIIRTWEKRYHRAPDFIVVEGPDAGGHLGFKEEEAEDPKFKLKEILRDILPFHKELQAKLGKRIPLFGAGSIFDGCELKEIVNMGCDGAQIGSRFIATEECDVSQEFKDLIVKSREEDVELFMSPVGMIARGIRNEFIDRVKGERVPSKHCIDCLKPCNPATTKYCISDALTRSVQGDVENGVVFCGSNVDRIDSIRTVKEVIDEIKEEFEACE